MFTDLNAERAVISYCLQGTPQQIGKALGTIKEIYFSDSFSRQMWRAMRSLSLKHERPTLVSLHRALLSEGLTMEIDKFSNVINEGMMWEGSLDDAISILREKFQQRTTYNITYLASQEIKENPHKPADEIIRRVLEETYQVYSAGQNLELDSKESIADEILQQVTSEGEPPIVSTTYPALDEAIDGFARGELTIIAGRPSMGKTALALSIAMRLAQVGIPVGFFNLDMGKEQIWHRMYAYLSGLSIKRFRRTERSTPFDLIEKRKLEAVRDTLVRLPIHIDSNPYHSSPSIRHTIRSLMATRNMRVVIVDHIGKVVPDRNAGNREREIGGIAEDFKRYTKEFDISMIVLSQLSRAVDQRNPDGRHKRPNLSDLRDSGSLEQEADIVIFPYRAEYYKLYSFEDGSSAVNKVDLDIAKNRQGKTSNVKLTYLDSTTSVVD